MRQEEDLTQLHNGRSYNEGNAQEILQKLRERTDAALISKEPGLTPGSPAFDPGKFLPELPKNTAQALVVLSDDMSPDERAEAEAELLIRQGAGAGAAVPLVRDQNAAGLAVMRKLQSVPVCLDCVWYKNTFCLHPAVCLPSRNPVDGSTTHQSVYARSCRQEQGKCGPQGILYASRAEVQTSAQRTRSELTGMARRAWSLRKAVHVSVPLYMVPPMALGAWLVEKLLEKIL